MLATVLLFEVEPGGKARETRPVHWVTGGHMYTFKGCSQPREMRFSETFPYEHVYTSI